MAQDVLIVYRSVTGFTERYARQLAEEIGCEAIALKDVLPERLRGVHTLVYGGRLHAGAVDGLNRARQLVKEASIPAFVVFATGASPSTAEAVIEETWKRNFSAEELSSIPHFYMPGGLKLEKLPFGDRMMIRVFSWMLKRKKDKTEFEIGFESAVRASFDITSKTNIDPLVALLKEKYKITTE